jgi:hypothetical protein
MTKKITPLLARMTLISGLCCSGAALAVGSVAIGNYTFTCQNTCVVSGFGTGLRVTDSDYGWVIKAVRTGAIPVPQNVAEPVKVDAK